MTTLEELTARALTRDARLPAIEFEKQWRTWGEMRQVADRVRGLIDASGARPRAPIVFIPRNRPSAIAALLGLIAAGCNIRMIYAFQSPAGIARDINRLNPTVVVAAAEDFSEDVCSTLRTRGIAGIALQEMDAAAVSGFERSTAAGDTPPDRPQIEILTSGTTGPPKQFAVSYDMIAQHMVRASVMNPARDTNPASEPPLLLFMPLGNISGIYSTLPGLLRGMRGFLLDRFTVAGWHDFVLRYRPEKGGLPPAGVQMVLDANIPPADLAGMRSIGTGAAPLDPTVHRAFEKRYGIPILLSYGATEFAGPVTAMTAELHAEWGEKKFGSVGRPFGGAQLRVIDPETGAILPPGKEGVLEVSVPRIGPDWIRTADVAVVDEDGFLFHRGRADGAIMRGGFKLLPETMERALLLHDAIAVAGVVGVTDRRLGQVPAAAVQLKPGVVQPSITELEKHMRDHVLANHIPVMWRFVESMPFTPSMKVDRRALRRLFETGTEASANIS